MRYRTLGLIFAAFLLLGAGCTAPDASLGGINNPPPSAGISNIVEDLSPQLGADLDLNGFNIDFPTTPDISDVIDDDTMATASATILSTSESIKAYVDSQVGGATTALDNLASVALNTALLPDVAAADDFGSATFPFKDLYFAGSSGTPGTNNFKITGASTSGTRTITFPDVSDTVQMQTLARISGSTFSTVQDLQNIFHSAGWVTGGGITDDADGTITVAAGTGLIRATDGQTVEILYFDWASEAGANVNLPDADTSYVYAEYNAGSPRVVAVTVERTDVNTNVLLATIYRDGTTLHINDADKFTVGDHAARMIQRLLDTVPYGRKSGGIISETGTRNIAFTAGDFWRGLTEFSTSAFDSSGADNFSYWYKPAGAWTEVTAQSAIDKTQYNDFGTGLATLSNNKYGVHWVYLGVDDDVDVVYGIGDYTLADAEDAQPPSSVPEHINVAGILAGKIIIKKDDDLFTQLESAFTTTFQGSLATDHGGLAGLADDDHTQYLLADGSRALAGAWSLGSQDLTGGGVITGSTLEATGATAADDNAAIGFTATDGIVITGQGSTYDMVFKNDADAIVFSVLTGTTGVVFAGATDVSAGTLTAASGTWDTGGIDLADTDSFAIAGVDLLIQTSGTATLSNIDALDPTTETTFEDAIDSLANLTVVGTIVTGTWNADVVVATYGGTGVASVTDGGLLIGKGTAAFANTGVLGDGTIVVGDGATNPVTLAAFTSSTGLLKHESGGLELDISSIGTGDILAGASAGVLEIVDGGASADGDVLTIQADGTANFETLPTASATVSGVSELATTAEIDGGSDTGRTIVPDTLSASIFGQKVAGLVIFDGATAVTSGSNTNAIAIPATMDGMNITDVLATVTDKGITGTTDVTVYKKDPAEGTVEVLSTDVTIGDEFFASDGVINTSFDDLATGDQLYVTVTGIHSGTAPNGLTVVITAELP